MANPTYHVPVGPLSGQNVLLAAGPFASPIDAQAYQDTVLFPGQPVDFSLINESGVCPSTGYWIVVVIAGGLGTPTPCHYLGVDCRCWPEGVPPHWTAQGGGKQAGAAAWGSSWIAQGGGKQAGAASIAQGSSWIAQGGGKQAGAALVTAAAEVLARGGGKQAGAALVTAAAEVLAQGGGKQSGAALVTAAAKVLAQGGGKQSGAALVTAVGTLYCQSTNVDTTCDVVADLSQDLAFTVGTGTSLKVYPAGALAERIVFDKLYTGKTGTYNVSLNVTNLAGTSPSGRFRLQVLNVACAVILNGTYSATFTTTGIKTLTDSLTWPAGGVRLRLSVEAGASGALPKQITVTDDANSYIIVPI